MLLMVVLVGMLLGGCGFDHSKDGIWIADWSYAYPGPLEELDENVKEWLKGLFEKPEVIIDNGEGIIEEEDV